MDIEVAVPSAQWTVLSHEAFDGWMNLEPIVWNEVIPERKKSVYI